MKRRMIRQLRKTLYSIEHYRLSQFPDLQLYVQQHAQLTNYDLSDVTIKLAETEDFQQVASALNKYRTLAS